MDRLEYSDLRKSPPAKSTPGGERNLNVPQTQAFQTLGVDIVTRSTVQGDSFI